MKLSYHIKEFLKWQTNKFKKYSLPTSLIYFITSNCNSNCQGCFYWNELNKKQQELTLDEIKKISKSLNKIHYLLISGGEPFLRKDIVEVCEVFINQNNLGGMHLPTNGLIPQKILKKTQELVERNKKLVLHMSLSLEGFEKTNDSLRCKGSFKKTLKTLSLLNEIKDDYPNFSIALNTVVSNRNYNEIHDFAKFVKDELKLSEHRIFPIRGTLKTKNLKPVSIENWLLLTQKLRNIKLKYLQKNINPIRLHLFLSARKRLNEVMVNSLKGKKWPFKCRAGDVIGVLEPEGSIRLCELTKKIGNIRDFDYDFKKIWHSNTANKLREEIKTRNCSKGCTHGCFLIPSLRYNPLNFLIPKIKLHNRRS